MNGTNGIERQLPSNLDAERATLGSLLMDRDAIIQVADALEARDFYLQKHCWVYEAVATLYGRRVPPDLQTVGDELRRAGRLAEIGDIAFLVELSSSVPTSYHVEYYARIVRTTAMRRRLIATGGRIAAMGYDEDDEYEATYATALTDLAEASPAVDSATEMTLNDAATRYVETLDSGRPRGISTGLKTLDRLIDGLMPKDLMILAARPGVGKSALAQFIGHYTARRYGRVDFQSAEMGDAELMERWLAMETGINSRRIRWHNGSVERADNLDDAEFVRVVSAAGRLAELPLNLDIKRGLTIGEIRLRALRRAARYGQPALYVADYLQLIHGTKSRYGSRTEEVGEVANGFKQLAGELNCPVIALAQLSRKPEERAEKRPVLSDLRESGEIEQSADIVGFLYRPAMYSAEEPATLCEIIVAKHRNGQSSDTAKVFYDQTTTRWGDFAVEEPATATPVIGTNGDGSAPRFYRRPGRPDARAYTSLLTTVYGA